MGKCRVGLYQSVVSPHGQQLPVGSVGGKRRKMCGSNCNYEYLSEHGLPRSKVTHSVQVSDHQLRLTLSDSILESSSLPHFKILRQPVHLYCANKQPPSVQHKS
jgi:hypothetical protein